MPVLVEDFPRIELAQIRALPTWHTIKQAGEVHLVLEYQGVQIDQRVRLTSDETPWGRRFWFVCSGSTCGFSRRLHLYLDDPGADQGGPQLLCRQCCAGGLTYFQQSMPGSRSRWREEVGLPILRQWRSTLAASSKVDVVAEAC